MPPCVLVELWTYLKELSTGIVVTWWELAFDHLPTFSHELI